MFSVMFLICNQEFQNCQTMVSTKVFETEEACMDALAFGFEYYTTSFNFVVIESVCYKWNTTLFDEAA